MVFSLLTTTKAIFSAHMVPNMYSTCNLVSVQIIEFELTIIIHGLPTEIRYDYQTYMEN